MKKHISKIPGFLISLIITIFICTGKAVAQSNEQVIPDNYYQYVIYFFLLILVLIVAAFFYFGTEVKTDEEIHLAEDRRHTLFETIRNILTRATPVEEEDEILLKDHNYDGIMELDNKIPPWFSWLFYVTILFGIYYMLDYHVFKASPLQEEEYEIEVKTAELKRAELEKSGAFVTEETVTQLTDDASLESGKKIFASNCVACHAPDGGGLVGPNLTDDYWIHGGGIKNIFKTITNGVPAKGMISWQTQLNPKQIQEVASFVMSIHGTTPANPKAPQGDLWQPEQDSTQSKL